MDMRKFGMLIVAGALTVVIALPVTGFAGQSNGKMKKQADRTQSRTMDRIQDKDQDRLRLRDGSCTSQTATVSGKMQKEGNTYGPGDGTGNDGVGPEDGTGYGAPSQR
jgi:hypothetical protein